MPILSFNNANIYYEKVGVGEPLILVAGYACDHTFWGLLQPILSKHYDVIMFDNRAVGQTTDNGKAFTVEIMAEDVLSLIQTLKLKRPHIIGHSMGGSIVQSLVKDKNDNLGKIIILNSACYLNSRGKIALRSLFNFRKNNVPLDLLIDAIMPWLFSSRFLTKDENILQFRKTLKNNPHIQSLRDQERQLAALFSFDARGLLSHNQNKTLVIASEDDILNTVNEAQELAKEINGQLELVQGGHSSPIEEPNKLSEIILSFLKSS